MNNVINMYIYEILKLAPMFPAILGGMSLYVLPTTRTKCQNKFWH